MTLTLKAIVALVVSVFTFILGNSVLVTVGVGEIFTELFALMFLVLVGTILLHRGFLLVWDELEVYCNWDNKTFKDVVVALCMFFTSAALIEFFCFGSFSWYSLSDIEFLAIKIPKTYLLYAWIFVYPLLLEAVGKMVRNENFSKKSMQIAGAYCMLLTVGGVATFFGLLKEDSIFLLALNTFSVTVALCKFIPKDRGWNKYAVVMLLLTLFLTVFSFYNTYGKTIIQKDEIVVIHTITFLVVVFCVLLPNFRRHKAQVLFMSAWFVLFLHAIGGLYNGNLLFSMHTIFSDSIAFSLVLICCFENYTREKIEQTEVEFPEEGIKYKVWGTQIKEDYDEEYYIDEVLVSGETTQTKCIVDSWSELLPEHAVFKPINKKNTVFMMRHIGAGGSWETVSDEETQQILLEEYIKAEIKTLISVEDDYEI